MTDTAPKLSLLQMNDFLFYVVFARHTDFVGELVLQMINNIEGQFAKFPHCIDGLARMRTLVRESRITHEHCVVLFFFLLAMDTRMRHWLLCAYEPPGERSAREKTLRGNLVLVPHGKASLPSQHTCPFLGQTVALRALASHRAVSILTSIAHESFFVSEDEESCDFATVYATIKRIVLFA